MITIRVGNLLGFCLVTALAGCSSLDSPARRGAGIKQQNFERIQAGMTELDVNAAFGAPAGCYNSGLYTNRFLPNDEAFDEKILTECLIKKALIDPSHKAKMWANDHGYAVIVFNQEGKVMRSQLKFSDTRLADIHKDTP